VRVSRRAWESLQAGELPGEFAEPLTRAGVWVADAEAERRRVLGYLDAVNRVAPGVTAAVFLGLACNFACSYCYEKPLGRAGAMPEATAERLCAFLLGRLRPGRWRDEPACRACPYLPLCFGGCRCLQFQREGTLAGIDCQRPFWDAALPALAS
jgi:radical SAM protein with 4Fe4S-binding SPASM domain